MKFVFLIHIFAKYPFLCRLKNIALSLYMYIFALIGYFVLVCVMSICEVVSPHSMSCPECTDFLSAVIALGAALFSVILLLVGVSSTAILLYTRKFS